MQFEHRRAKTKGNGRTCFWRLRRRLQRWWGFECFPFLAMVKKTATPVWVHCFLSITDGSVINCFLAGTKTGLIRDSPLPFSPFLFIYFLVYALFFFGFFTLFWVDVSVLDSVFSLGCVLCALLFWVDCSVFFLGLSPPWFCQLLGIYRDQSSSPSASRLSS